ncbi:thioredoxin domain-containing protein [Arenibacter sp. 6A1]|uniref:vitamin K epoxide reductase family protein n=1 Tax=Arenibacter sp. 6A1 TaxID=2720391 RepID=UPI0014465DF3|nr:vitamin K epoxide reductase family protein [Arenibacter sp. 6A1]NKI24939.1 thioredoxin domain-containing protein [Arenibacter sp. 6A1]
MDNCTTSIKTLLNLLQIKFTENFIEDCILSHPDHPSLLCISDTLDRYVVENLALKVDEAKLSELPLPCIVQLSDHGGLFHVLTGFSGDKAIYVDDSGKPIKLPKEEFLDRWTGVCLLADRNESSGEPGIEKRLREKRTMSILTSSAAILLLITIILMMAKSPLIAGYNSFFLGAYVLLKLVGLAMGAMLLWYEVDKYNPSLQSFCSGGKKIDCDAVLGSKYAKVFIGNISLNLLVFSYFFGTLSYLAITSFTSGSLQSLTLLSAAALPLVMLSGYYQGVVIKQWCKFCIVVQGVLVLEMMTAFFGGFYKTGTSWETLPLFLALLLLPIIVWKRLKPLLETKKETVLYKRNLKKIKNNPDVLRGLLAKTRKIATGTEGLGISLNNDNAKYHVVKVCNPYCGPCAKAHPELEELVSKGKINLQILFTAHTDENDLRRKPVSHFLALDAQGDKGRMREALDDWYNAGKMDYESFANKYPLNGELEKQNVKIEAMRQWCDIENITHTPTIFINGHELPKEYSVDDLKEVLI